MADNTSDVRELLADIRGYFQTSEKAHTQLHTQVTALERTCVTMQLQHAEIKGEISSGIQQIRSLEEVVGIKIGRIEKDVATNRDCLLNLRKELREKDQYQRRNWYAPYVAIGGMLAALLGVMIAYFEYVR